MDNLKAVYTVRDRFGVLGVFTSYHLLADYIQYYKKNWPKSDLFTEQHILNRKVPNNA